jgi:hypothetical protein
VEHIKISTEYDGKSRTLYRVLATECEHYVYAPKHRMDRKYCSRVCRDKRPRILVKRNCGFCLKEILRSPSKLGSKSGLLFCNRLCKEKAQSLESGILQIAHYMNGRSVYRDRALKKYGSRCVVCSYDEIVWMLDVDHIDSDRENNSVENLQVLCAWHHVLKTRLTRMGKYGGLAQLGQSVAPAMRRPSVRIR